MKYLEKIKKFIGKGGVKYDEWFTGNQQPNKEMNFETWYEKKLPITLSANVS